MGLVDKLFARPTSTPHAQAQVHGEQGVAIYWRPGCPYCVKLRAAVRRQTRDAAWVDIWQDPEAAAFVRSVNNGNEVVPTVVIDGVAHTNPPPALVKEALKRTA